MVVGEARRLPPSMEALYARPLSCDPTGLMPLEFHHFHWIEMWLCLTASGGAGQSQQRVLGAAGTVFGICPPWACRGTPRGSPVTHTHTCLLKLRSGAASARFANLSSHFFCNP